jgi:hypothetical protein
VSKSLARRLLDERFHGELDQWLAKRRAAGDSWRTIATKIEERTDLKVSHETLRAWHKDGQGS